MYFHIFLPYFIIVLFVRSHTFISTCMLMYKMYFCHSLLWEHGVRYIRHYGATVTCWVEASQGAVRFLTPGDVLTRNLQK